MKRILIFVLVFIFFGLNAQPPKKFYCRYGGDGVDIGYSVKETLSKSYIIIGSTTSFGAGGTDAYMLLVDSMGNLTWQKTFGGIGNDVGKNIIINPVDSGYIFTGFTSSFDNGYDVYVVRTDKTGNLIWQKNFGTNAWDFGNDLCIGKDGNIFVCGYSSNTIKGKNDGYLLKVNINDGNLIWQRFIGGKEDDSFESILLTSDNNITTAGNTGSYNDVKGDFWIYKVNLNGDSLLSKTFGKINVIEVCYDMLEDKNSDLVLSGSYDTSTISKSKNVSYLMKLSLNGTFLNDLKIQDGLSDDNDRVSSVTKSKIGYRYYFTRRYSNHANDIDIQPVIGDYNLILYTATTYGNSDEDNAFAIEGTSDNGFAIVGYTKGSGITSHDLCLIKALDTSIVITGQQYISNIKENVIDDTKKVYYYNGCFFILDKSLINNKYEIFTSTGKLMQKGIVNSEIINIDYALNSGYYILKINDLRSVLLKFLKE